MADSVAIALDFRRQRAIVAGRRRYLTLGLESEGWTPKRAQEELENVLADVRRGLWVPPRRGGGEGGGGAPTQPTRGGPAGGGAVEPPMAGGEMLFGEFAPGRSRSAAPTTATPTIATSAGA